MMVKSNLSEIQQDKDYTMLVALNNQVLPVNHTATVEYQARNKQMILKDKKISCELDTHNTMSSLTSEVESISKEKTCSTFWNKQVLEMSRKLWLPIVTGSAGLDLNLLNGSLISTMLNSWYSMTVKVPLNKNLLQTCSQLLPCFPVVFTDSGNTIIRSRKIRFYPTKQQKILLFKWFGTARYSYNKTVEYLKNSENKANWMQIKAGLMNQFPEWSNEVPYQIKSIAVRDACLAVTAAKKKYKLTGQINKVSFRSRKRGNFNLFIPKSALRENGFYHTLVGTINLRESVGNPDYDCRVILENDRYFLIKPENRAVKKPDNQRYSVVALDPGVRTFQTIYSDNFAIKVAQNDFSRIYRLCYLLDKMYSNRKKQITNKYNVKLKKIRWKIKDLISELHHKLALFLVKTFDNILIPSFETSNMVTKLHSKVARAMLGWSHYKFKQFLKYKAEEYSCNVIEVNESYTSKTCGNCGKQQNIGSKEVFKCSCGLVIDRDLNGARNILLKNASCVERFFHGLANGVNCEPQLASSNTC